MPGRAWLIVSALVVGATAATTVSAQAAVRICGDAVAATASGQTETGARKAALDQWKGGAAEIGSGYTSWRLAVEKMLSCHRLAGAFVCNVRGRPCVLRQVPAAMGQEPAY